MAGVAKEKSFVFWCQSASEQASWVTVLAECILQPENSPEPRNVMEDMVRLIRDRHIVSVDVGKGPKSTLGLVVTGVRVVSIVPGAPSSMPLTDIRTNSTVHIEVGDCLIDVDGKNMVTTEMSQYHSLHRVHAFELRLFFGRFLPHYSPPVYNISVAISDSSHYNFPYYLQVGQ